MQMTKTTLILTTLHSTILYIMRRFVIVPLQLNHILVITFPKKCRYNDQRNHFHSITVLESGGVE